MSERFELHLPDRHRRNEPHGAIFVHQSAANQRLDLIRRRLHRLQRVGPQQWVGGVASLHKQLDRGLTKTGRGCVGRDGGAHRQDG